MDFNFSKHNLDPKQQKLQRLLEMLPGLTSWTILIGMTVLSFVRPIPAAILIIAFEFYWLLRLVYVTLFLVLSYYALMAERRTDWMERIKGIDRLASYRQNIIQAPPPASARQKVSWFIHRRELRILEESKSVPPPSPEIYHLVILPVVKEPREVVEPAVESISRQKFPSQRIIVLLALEERAAPEVKESIAVMEEKYKSSFLHIATVIHPDNLPGEARVKGANATYAAKYAAEYFDSRRIAHENVIVSCFDADTVVGPDYFSALTYYFMITPSRLRASYQPIPVYHNNIWEVPGFARVIETGSSFFQLVEATNSEKLVTFSSHSMSFKALVDVGYWPVDMISDDSAIYWKSFIHYDGDYRVVPMYVTLSMDIAAADTFTSTVKSIYKQKRRWAWGVENFPIVMRGFLRNHKISLYDKLRFSIKLFEGHISWATWGFLLTFIGWIPAIFAEQEFTTSVVYYNAPQIMRTIFHLAPLSLLISIILSIGLLPKRELKHPFLLRVGLATEWLLLPFALAVFGSLPALDAQTRLMLGKYMEFWVTDKQRRNKTNSA